MGQGILLSIHYCHFWKIWLNCCICYPALSCNMVQVYNPRTNPRYIEAKTAASWNGSSFYKGFSFNHLLPDSVSVLPQLKRDWDYHSGWMQSYLHQCGLYIVGSSVSGFGGESSDMDLCLVISSYEIDQRFHALEYLYRVQKALSQYRMCHFLHSFFSFFLINQEFIETRPKIFWFKNGQFSLRTRTFRINWSAHRHDIKIFFQSELAILSFENGWFFFKSRYSESNELRVRLVNIYLFIPNPDCLSIWW